MRRLYNPTIEKPDDLKKTLIARGPILNDLLKKIRSLSNDRGLKHYLIVGPRGIGKTHLLLVLHYTVKGCYKEKSLAKSWISIKTYEEEYRITTLSDLLLRVLEELKEEGSSDKVDSILERLRGRSDEEIAELALGFLREFRKKTGKRILLLIEDLGTIFEQIGDETAIGRIRDILMREDIFMFIGTALSLFKEVVGHGKPFYNFFEVIWLPELKGKEVEELIKKRAKVLGEGEIIEKFEEYRPRIKATIHLTGGYPRLILMLFHIFTKSKLIEVQEALEELLDELTPYFQDRMSRLPPQQRKILDTLTLMEGPATPTEIAKEARLDVRIVNPQIRRLAELGYIRVSRQKRRKTTRYEVTERLFRIWREMRTIKGRKRIGFLVKFLKIWYTPKEFIKEAEKLEISFRECASSMEAEKVVEHLWYLQEAAPLRLKCLIHQSRVSKLLEMGKITEAEKEVKRLRKEAERGEKEEVLIVSLAEEAQLYSFKGNGEQEADILKKVLDFTPRSSEVWFRRGDALAYLGKYEGALDSFTKALKIKPDSHTIWHKRGHLLGILGKYEEALEDLTKSLDLAPDCSEAWFHRGRTLGALGRYEEALESFNKALDIDSDYAEAWVFKGRALMYLDRNDEALGNLEKALKLKPDLYIAWNIRGEIFEELGKHKKALEDFNKALEIKPDYAEAWVNKGETLDLLEKHDEALESFQRALELSPESYRAWQERGWILTRKLKRHKDAIESFNKALELKPDFETAWCRKGVALEAIGKYEEALKSFNKALELKPKCFWLHYYQADVLSSLKRHGEALEELEEFFLVVKDKQDEESTEIKKTAGILGSKICLSLSQDSALQKNYGAAEDYLKKALTYGEIGDTEELQKLIVDFLKRLIAKDQIEFAQQALRTTGELKGSGFAELLRPFSIALSYIRTQDLKILEGLHEEVREVVEEIIQKTERGKGVQGAEPL